MTNFLPGYQAGIHGVIYVMHGEIPVHMSAWIRFDAHLVQTVIGTQSRRERTATVQILRFKVTDYASLIPVIIVIFHCGPRGLQLGWAFIFRRVRPFLQTDIAFFDGT